jgi:polygalacturonase
LSVDLTIKDIMMVDSPYWTLHPIYCSRVLIRDVTITSSALSPLSQDAVGEGGGSWGPNTDGIDPDSCSDVVIENYVYCGGDDAIAIKSGWNYAGIEFGMPSRNIFVRNASSGCRGGFTIGSEMSGGVENVTFRDCTSTGESGIRISSELGRGGYVRDVSFENMAFTWEKDVGKSFLFHVNQVCVCASPNNRVDTTSAHVLAYSGGGGGGGGINV